MYPFLLWCDVIFALVGLLQIGVALFGLAYVLELRKSLKDENK